MNATEALQAARRAGIECGVDGDDLVLKAAAPPPAAVLAMLSTHKAGIVRLLRSYQRPVSPIDGYLNAARQRPPSWSDSAALPSVGAFCSCCRQGRWWCEIIAPKGWRCWQCHPPVSTAPGSVREVKTDNQAAPAATHGGGHPDFPNDFEKSGGR